MDMFEKRGIRNLKLRYIVLKLRCIVWKAHPFEKDGNENKAFSSFFSHN